MANKSSISECTKKCDALYKDCVEKGEHESVCRMKRVPCDCSCALP